MDHKGTTEEAAEKVVLRAAAALSG